MGCYDFLAIESKWQKYWADNETFVQPNPGDENFNDKPKMYVLDMFPYPSGTGLHVGHPEGYTATDIVCRYRRMKGYNVLHPMGYDSFGLPAEQYAVEHGVHPRETTENNIANIERQIKMFGFSYDWSRRIATTDVDYYRWTQWIFLQLFNSYYDLAQNKAAPISELIANLESGRYMIDLNGNPVLCLEHDASAITGITVGMSHWDEIPGREQRAIIDSQRLAFMAEVPVNWCPQLGTVLANEEVTNDGKSERGNYPVYRRNLKQWMLRITAYAERLLDDIDGVDWPEPIKIMQRNWIGKSTGAEVLFEIECGEAIENEKTLGDLRVYTTRPDTLFGATYMVLAPEHPMVADITTAEQKTPVEQYVIAAGRKSEMDRMTDTKEKTGVFTGGYAINPANGAKIPVWVADYVMMGYGTGAIMAVPAHDTRDYEFATTFDLPIVQVVEPPQGQDWKGYVGNGIAVNSGEYNGLTTAEFQQRIIARLEKDALGHAAVNYKLRDWLFSRQRYWGEPLPVVHCDKCGIVPLSEDDLPLELPEMHDFRPASSDDPNAPPSPPLGKMTDWVKTTCPQCGAAATRELNTMPQWAGSCWYYLRYLDPKNRKNFVDPEIEKYWMGEGTDGGVDLYVGGAEHAVLHLLYSRFWHKVLFDLGHVSTPEPFHKLFNQGMIRSYAYRDSRGVCVGYDDIDFRDDGAYLKTSGEKLAESVEKMSKSLKNVVNPDEIIQSYGADTFRLYEMFMGPLDASKPWNTRDVPGLHRFLQRTWRMIAGGEEDNQPPLLGDEADDAVEKALHKLIRKVGEDVEAMKFNTAIAAMMEFVNTCFRSGCVSKSQAERFVLVLAPFAPHISEELWEILGHAQSLGHEPFPTCDEAMLVETSIVLPVQVNGKLRGKIRVSANTSQDEIIAAALADEKVIPFIDGKTVVKQIVIPGRLVNLVVKQAVSG